MCFYAIVRAIIQCRMDSDRGKFVCKIKHTALNAMTLLNVAFVLHVASLRAAMLIGSVGQKAGASSQRRNGCCAHYAP